MTEPLILSIETSGKFCSVALSRGAELLGERESSNQFDHSALLVPYIHDVLSSSDTDVHALDAVALSAGPGSYTGLRVGASTVKAICYATGCQLIAVDTLEAVAWEAITQVDSDGVCFPALDSRRSEVYIAAFDTNGNRLFSDMALEIRQDTFCRLIAAGEKIFLCGPGAGKCAPEVAGSTVLLLPFEVRASHLITPALKQYYNAQFADIVTFTPKYIKAPNITKSTKPLF